MTKAWWREPTRAQWLTFLAAWLGWVLDAFDFTIFLLAMPQIAKQFNVTITATASSITLTLLFRLVGGVAAGAAADRWGRKWPLMISIVWFALCDGAVAYAPSFLWILVLRTLFGFGMGAEWASGATLAMENWPKRSRGLASGVLQGSWAIGYFLAAMVAGYVLPKYGYHALFLIAAAPALLVIPIRLFVPEGEGREPESITPAERGGLTRTLVWACIVVGVAFAAYYSLTAIYPTMLTKQLKLSPGQMSHTVAWFNVGMLMGSIFCGYLATRRSPVLAIMLPAVLTLPVLPIYVGLVAQVPLSVGAFLGGMFGAGYVGVTPLLLTAMFPANIRGRAVGFVYHVGACMAALAPPLIAALSEKGGMPLNRSIAICTATFQILLLLLLLFRPRDIFDDVPATTVPKEGP